MGSDPTLFPTSPVASQWGESAGTSARLLMSSSTVRSLFSPPGRRASPPPSSLLVGEWPARPGRRRLPRALQEPRFHCSAAPPSLSPSPQRRAPSPGRAPFSCLTATPPLRITQPPFPFSLLIFSAPPGRSKLHFLCRYLEIPLTGRGGVLSRCDK